MASLLFAASYLTYNKVKAKIEENKEKKRKVYADRYSELKREHAREMEKRGQHPGPGSSSSNSSSKKRAEPPASPVQCAEIQGRRSTSESLRSDGQKADGPSAWVHEVIRKRSGERHQNHPQSGREEARLRHLI